MKDFGVAFSIMDFDIKWYSILILLGVVFGYLLINSEAKRFNIRKEFVFNLMFWVIIVGIICARIYYVLFNFDYYKANPSEIYKIWHGGIAIHGGIIGGAITLILYCKKYGSNTKRIMDIVVPALLLAQAIGRWGNFFNNEAYGVAVAYQNLLDLRIIPSFIIDNMYINGAYHIPTFYFESILCVIGVIIMFIIRRRKYVKCGAITAFYLIWYGVIRFFIEIYRTDSLMLGTFRVAQIVSIIEVLIGFVILLSLSRKPKLDGLYNAAIIEETRF